VRVPCLGVVVALIAVFSLSSGLLGQTDQRPKVSPASPPAATHDLSGIWMEQGNAVMFSSKEPPLLPWAEAKYRTAKPGYGPQATPDSQDPILNCLPPGVPRILLMPFPIQIVHAPGQVIMLFEYDHYVRTIFTDRKQHPRDLDPTWMGDSVGHWEGDTLVVDTVGLTDKSWLDQVGHPHSEALHVVERIRRVDRDTLQDDIMIDDSKAYTKAWTGQQIFKFKPTWHLMEYICEDNMSEPRK
jgi:hypothetical protein